MHVETHVEEHEPPTGPDDLPPKTARRKALQSLLAVFGLGALLLGLWLVVRGDRPTAPPPPESVTQATTTPATPPSRAESDERIRLALAGLSAAPEWQSWLGAEDLARRVAAASQRIADGDSPRVPLSMMAPQGPFSVLVREGRTYTAPTAYARYDRTVRVLTAIDARAASTAFSIVKPLVEAVHREIAPPGRTLDMTLASALGRIAKTPIPDGEIELTSLKGGLWGYADPKLEALSDAEKHLLRLGPANARAVQAKARELAKAMNLALVQ